MENNQLYAKGIAADKELSYALSMLKLFRDQDGNLHAIVQDGDRHRVLDHPGSGLARWLRRVFLIKKTVLSPIEVERIVAYIEALSEADNIPQYTHFNRVGQRKRTLYYDLSMDDNDIIKISAKGVSMLNNADCRVLFKQAPPQVIPDLTASPDTLMNRLRPYFRVSSDANFLLLCVYICTCFVYEISHPILVVYGSQGSAKSTTLELIGRTVDPRHSHRATLSPDRKSMVSAISSRHFFAYDNLRSLKQWQSDLLCCASTGGSEPMRVLYTTSDVKEVNLKCCVALNGISVIATEPDLLDRAILIEMTRIPDDEYEPEDSLYKRFATDLPNILGAIFNTLSGALRRYDTVESFPRTRMQDFAKYGYCIAEALGGYGEAFIKAYQKNKQRSQQESRLPLVAECLLSFMLYNSDWTGNMTLLYEHLSKIARSKRQSVDFPANPSALSREINALKKQLTENGIFVTSRHGSSRTIKIKNENIHDADGCE